MVGMIFFMHLQNYTLVSEQPFRSADQGINENPKMLRVTLDVEKREWQRRSDRSQEHARAWAKMTKAEMELRIGKLSASEARAIRKAMKWILPEPHRGSPNGTDQPRRGDAPKS